MGKLGQFLKVLPVPCHWSLLIPLKTPGFHAIDQWHEKGLIEKQNLKK